MNAKNYSKNIQKKLNNSSSLNKISNSALEVNFDEDCGTNNEITESQLFQNVDDVSSQRTQRLSSAKHNPGR